MINLTKSITNFVVCVYPGFKFEGHVGYFLLCRKDQISFLVSLQICHTFLKLPTRVTTWWWVSFDYDFAVPLLVHSCKFQWIVILVWGLRSVIWAIWVIFALTLKLWELRLSRQRTSWNHALTSHLDLVVLKSLSIIHLLQWSLFENLVNHSAVVS